MLRRLVEALAHRLGLEVVEERALRDLEEALRMLEDWIARGERGELGSEKVERASSQG
jgi:hypothetical protein